MVNQWNLLRHKGAAVGKVFTGPQSVEIYLTDACALSCHFCPYHFAGDEKYGARRKDLDFGVFQNLIDDSRALHTDFITFSGEGDPFSHPEICPMVAYVKDMGLTLDINTHGLFGKKLLPFAQRADCLNINIPGVDEESYKNSQFDRKDCFKQVLDNVRLLSVCSEAQRPELNWVYVITLDSFQHLGRVLELADELGFDKVTFRLAILHEGNDRLAPTGEHLKELKKEIAAALRASAGHKVKSNILKIANEVTSIIFYDECRRDMPSHSRGEQRRSIYFEKTFPEHFSCLVGWHKAFVDINGDVIFCCGNLQTVVGNVYKETFRQIWCGAKADLMRFEMKHHFDLRKDFFRECRTCPYMITDGSTAASGQMEWSKG